MLLNSINTHLASGFRLGKTCAKNSKLLDTKSRLITSRRPASTTARLYPLRPKEDAKIAEFWHKKVIPELASILKRFVNQDYTVSLVRKTTASGPLYIHIQSYRALADSTQDCIRKEIEPLLHEEEVMSETKIRFLKGRLRTLAGVSRPQPYPDFYSDDESTEPQPYPWYERYWRKPGPGASVGLRCTNKVSATLGCYVEVDSRLFLLTVNHFIEESFKCVSKGTDDFSTLISPALSDVTRLRSDLERRLKDYELQLHTELKDQEGDKYTPLSDLAISPDQEWLAAAIEIAKDDISHIEQDGQHLNLGKVEHQCSSATTQKRRIPNEHTFPHLLDWALCSVIESRKGSNNHRYGYGAANGEVDFFAEHADTCGAGVPIMETAVIKPGDKVHFVGHTTGRVPGIISQSRVHYVLDGAEREDWVIHVSDNAPKSLKAYEGASGAAVIRDSDNKLLGILWACTDDGLLVFTPINDIFDDIRRVAGASHVCLPNVLPPSPSASIGTRNAQQICRVDPTEKRTHRNNSKKFEVPFIPEKARRALLQQKKQVLHDKAAITEASTSIVNQKSNNTSRITLQHGQLKLFLRAPEDKKFRWLYQYILSKYFHQPGSRRRSTFPRAGTVSVQRTGTWPTMAARNKDQKLGEINDTD